MKKTSLLIVILTAIIGCNSRPDLSGQLKTDLSSRLLKVDSFVVVDSFKIVGVDTLNARLGKIIDDTIYMQLFHSVQKQLAHALTRPRKDSIEYFQGEIDYMSGQIDTLTESIKTADTTHKFGILARCYYQISKHGRNNTGSLFYFIKSNGYIINSEMLDSFIARSYRKLK